MMMFRSPSPSIDVLPNLWASGRRTPVDSEVTFATTDGDDDGFGTATNREEMDCIDQIQRLVQQKKIQVVALDFDETITVRGLQQGAPFDVLYGADDVIWNNIRNPSFLRALLYAIYEGGGRICIVSFQDDLVGNTEMGVVTGRALIERYIDVLLGYDRPNDLLRYNEDYILWNPHIRCAGTTTAVSTTGGNSGANKNQHLMVMTMFSGRSASFVGFGAGMTTAGGRSAAPTSSTTTTITAAVNRPPPDSIVFIDDSVANVTAANSRNIARGFVAKQGIDVSLCRQIIQTYNGVQPYRHSVLASQNVYAYQQQPAPPHQQGQSTFKPGGSSTMAPTGPTSTTTTTIIPAEFNFGYSSALARRPSHMK